MPRVARNTIFGFVLIISLTIFITAAAIAQNATNPDGATFDPDGTAHITRLVPMPKTVSPEAQQWLKEIAWEGPQPKDLAALRAGIDEWRKKDSAKALRLYPVKIEKTKIAGVHTDMITPLAETQRPRAHQPARRRFVSDSGSLIEGIPIAYLTKIKVVSVYYRLAPENPFPAAVYDVVAVYKELLKTYQPKRIGIFGTSAGAILTGEVAARLKQSGMQLPGALGIFPPWPISAGLRIRNSCLH